MSVAGADLWLHVRLELASIQPVLWVQTGHPPLAPKPPGRHALPEGNLTGRSAIVGRLRVDEADHTPVAIRMSRHLSQLAVLWSGHGGFDHCGFDQWRGRLPERRGLGL